MSGDRLWLAVQSTFDKGVKCEDCPHFETWTEHHGPGLNEPMCRCLVLDNGSDPELCPGAGDLADEEET